MPDTLSSGQTPFDTWIKLIENTMKGNPAAQTVNKQDRGDAGDPWTTLIDQLWRANPYSKLLPIDPVEMTRALQRIWLDTINNPVRAWTNYSDFVQGYTQIMAETTLKFWGRG